VVWSATLIRKARLRGGLTQRELADRSGRKRSVIARWERGVIEPSLETLLEIIGVCGFELPLELMPRYAGADERLGVNARLSPERRVQRLLKASVPDEPFDPYAILAALERRRTAYVVIGAFARIVQGAEETTSGIDIALSLRGDNLARLGLAVGDLGAARDDRAPAALDELKIHKTPFAEFNSQKGKLTMVPEPAGTRGGYDDLRRAAAREPIGRGLRVSVASTAHLARMLAAFGREADMPKLIALRRLQALERTVGHDLKL
jgi:transcriptional regulator with XRE-family HTH domain